MHAYGLFPPPIFLFFFINDKMTKELSPNTLPYTWVANDLILTRYPKMSDYYKDHEPSMANVLIKTYNFNRKTYKINFIVKNFDIIIDGTTYDRSLIAKQLNTPNIEMLIPDIDINKDYNIFSYNTYFNEFRKLQ